MRVLAESKPVIVMPFVHVGYAAASHPKPQGGLLLAGSILFVAGVGMTLRKPKVGVLGKRLRVLGICGIIAAFLASERYYPHGAEVTRSKMENVLRFIGSPENSPIGDVPTAPGRYDLVALACDDDQDQRYKLKDCWRTPMKLRVVATPEGKVDYFVLSAGADREWNTEDDMVSESYSEYARKYGSVRDEEAP